MLIFGNSGVRNQLVLLAFALALPLVSLSVRAVDTTIPVQLKSTSTDGKPYASKFAVSVTRANSTAQITAVNINESIDINATWYADPAHVNKLADLFAVVRDGSTFYMKTVDGIFVKWDYPNLGTLKPFKENVVLTSEYTASVYSGIYAAASTENIFVGYMSKGSPALIYTPQPANLTVQVPAVPINPLTFYSDNIENVLIQKRCIACHVTGGLAKDSRLVYERSSSSSTANNFNTLKNLINSQPDPLSYVLTKVTGGNNHGGGAQVSPGSSDYNALSGFIQLVTGDSNITLSDVGSFFNGVSLQPRADTLRKAAIMLASRLPTGIETQAVSSGDENTLRTTLRGLMSGTGFHKFITEGTNDRLLTENLNASSVIDAAWGNYMKLSNTLYTLKSDAIKAGSTAAQANSLSANYYNVADFGMRASVEEQVAYVVENEKPYTEILTGDYMMMTPRLNYLLEGDAVFNNPDNLFEFQPGRIGGYYTTPTVSWTRGTLGTFTTLNKGSTPVKWPHIGILNNIAFLNRYPSTPTNRNRARARWTLLNFMDIDIEKSTQRPTDPAALADKNNPTMNNPNCYACHERMDPVAAAFQNYYDFGSYLLFGTDSLDPFYKNAAPYVKGDKWYRDMRSPGLLGHAITSTTEPLRDLATLITQDPAFARATVKFWWPAVMNSSVLLAPAVSTDADYPDRLAAYQAQASSIEQFATNFGASYNLKDLLVDMMMSPWFRIDGKLASANTNASLIAGVSTRKLLTPERLHRKTLALTGFNWRSNTFPRYEGRFVSGLTDDYRLLYGGIDSLSIIERSRDMTPLMDNVAQTHAVESSCPIVLKEFALPDAKRKLFGGISDKVTPATEAGAKAIKTKLAELHRIMHGKNYAIDSPEITAAYKLFVDTWQSKTTTPNYSTNLTYPNQCLWTQDWNFLDGLGYTGTVHTLAAAGNFYSWDTNAINAFLADYTQDALHTKQTWTVVMTYLMTHYYYLYE